MTTALAERVSEELAGPAPEEARVLAEALARRFGAATAAVLFYGSCLRRSSGEGVLDFYVLVSDYRRAYPSRWLALLNRTLPPNVFNVECEHVGDTVRAKVAVLSVDHFESAVSPRWVEARVWARFAQPARLLYARDEETRRAVVRDVAAAVRTFVGHLPAWLPDPPLTADRFWPAAFAETYRAELRSERPETIRALYDAAPARYAEMLELARKEPDAAHDPTADEVRRRWRRCRITGKAWSTLGLLKCVFTFDDWAGYALWKLERHRGRPIPISDRQRRHPLLFGWPILWHLLRTRTLR